VTLDGLLDGALVAFVLRALIPVLLAALGGLICERAGVFNVALEGLMLFGAFAAVTASYYTGSWVIAIVVAIAVGALASLVLAYGSVTRGGNAIVVGIALNLLAVGLTGLLLKAIFDVSGILQSDQVVGIPSLSAGLDLAGIPLVGEAIATATVITVIALVAVPATDWTLYRTTLGLRLRGVGEHAEAAQTLGVNPARLQYLAVITSGVLCGLAGAQLALGNIVKFAEQMTAGRGWIAVVAVMLGRARPYPTLAACLLFGIADAIGFRLQGQNLPTQVTDAAPYVVTLLALILVRRRYQVGGSYV
jgi:general nucleoside transport system permease protein